MPSNDRYIYVDDDTGDQYIFDGTKLVKISGNESSQDNDKSNNNQKKPQIGDKADLSDEDKEREEKAKKEREESGEEEETVEQRKARLDRIKRYLSNQDVADQASYESEKKVTAEKKRKEAARKKDLEKNLSGAERNSRIVSLLGQDLKKFLSKVVGQDKRVSSWRKYNANYARSGLLMPSSINEPVGKIPVIQVYIDQSGSWDENDVLLANNILKSIKEFEDKNLIKIQVYYFANNIYDNPQQARQEGGTRAGSKIMQQLNDQKPDNVIILTDDDFDGQGFEGSYTAPGGVWMVFRQNRSKKLMNGLKGKLQTKYYDIDKI